MSSEPSYESHASAAEQEAQRLYGEGMQAEDARYQEALAALHAEHEANVARISEGYTKALAEAGGGIPF